MNTKMPTKTFVCTRCGKQKEVLMNHDDLNEIFERCTDECMWANDNGPSLYSASGEVTGFRKCKMIKVEISS